MADACDDTLGQLATFGGAGCSFTFSEAVDAEEENGEGEDNVEEVDAQVVDAAAAVTIDSASGTASLAPRALTEHCLSCLRFLILSWSPVYRHECPSVFSPPGRAFSSASFSCETADVEADEVEYAGDETVGGGEVELRKDTSVEDAEEWAGEDNDVEEDTVPSPWLTSAGRSLLAALIRSRRRCFAGHRCTRVPFSRGSRPLSRGSRMRDAHDDRPSHAATADLLVLVVAVAVVAVFVAVVIVLVAALPGGLAAVLGSCAALAASSATGR